MPGGWRARDAAGATVEAVTGILSRLLCRADAPPGAREERARGGSMSEDQSRPADDAPGEIRLVAPLTEGGGEEGGGEEGGDPVCWAHLVCGECGAITTEGHRAGCSMER
jgi:hypothetical protein